MKRIWKIWDSSWHSVYWRITNKILNPENANRILLSNAMLKAETRITPLGTKEIQSRGELSDLWNLLLSDAGLSSPPQGRKRMSGESKGCRFQVLDSVDSSCNQDPEGKGQGKERNAFQLLSISSSIFYCLTTQCCF